MRTLLTASISFLVLTACYGQTQVTASVPFETAPAMTVEGALDQLEHGQSIQAIDSLRKFADSQPPAKGADRGLAIAYYRTGKLDEAERAFAKAMTDDLSDRESVQMRGLTLYRMGRQTDAIPYLERARQWSSNANVDANYVLGLCYKIGRAHV